MFWFDKCRRNKNFFQRSVGHAKNTFLESREHNGVHKMYTEQSVQILNTIIADTDPDALINLETGSGDVKAGSRT